MSTKISVFNLISLKSLKLIDGRDLIVWIVIFEFTNLIIINAILIL